MKLFAFLAAGAVVASAMIPAAASAQRHDRVVERHTVVRHGPTRNHWRTRTVCRTVWNHGHRNRVCRQVRR